MYAEIIVNYWKAVEAVLGKWKRREVVSSARGLGLGDMASELGWLCDRRNDDDVAHAVRKYSAEAARTLNVERGEKVQRAERVVRAMIDRVLDIPPNE